MLWVSRHDYKPFGIELVTESGRTTGLGYGATDGVRDKFTGYERDTETGLDYAQARYYSSAQGRFTGSDPLMASATTVNPKTWTRYAYALNNPLRYTDPTGLRACEDASCSGYEDDENQSRAELDYEQRLQRTRDGIAAKNAWQDGNYSRVEKILKAKSHVGLSVGGVLLWGEIGAAFSSGYGTPIEMASVQFQFPIDPQAILIRRGFAAVSKLMSNIRSPDFKIFNISVGAGITRFIARGDDMSTALQGVSGGPQEAQVSFAVGWMLQRAQPTRDEIRNWGSGLSFNADFFFIGGGGIIFSPNAPKTGGVYVGVGAGGGPSGSFSYSVW